ncbi:hypothetical protein MACJ_001773 [Theileria orientalis]|uniref:Uncharacterized protein n=1 Tax=Theileria orientalis TaxID=68886 RepID=A0A976QU06_THEOR|nr:hypothetical protein MACJ_001773 [Theileria orientalis]
MSEHSPGGNISCKLIAAFIALSSHLIMHQIDVTSAHFSVAFSIPLNNISIYFSKLFSFRCLLIAVGTFSEFLISEIFKHLDFGALNGVGKKDNKYRKYISMACFALVLAIRVLLLIFLYRSSNLGYYVYIILSVEAFFFGYFHASVLAIVPEHSLAVALAANVSRLFILLTQFCLDAILYTRPLLMIKLQVLIGVVMTGIAVVLWFYYHQIGPCSSHITSGSTDLSALPGPGGIRVKEEKGFGRTFADAISPFMMFFVGSMFKDFLYPGVLPYALLKRDICHIINMLVPVSNMIGPVVLFFLEIAEVFPIWEPSYNWFWVFAIPMAMTFVLSFMPIHTRIPFFRSIINSRIKVMYMTLGVVFCNGFLDPLSFGGVAKVVKPQFRGKARNGTLKYGDNRLITFHAILALFMRFVFSKISVGYNDTRVSLGYCLPKFRPLHRMSKHNTFWYILRQTFKTAWKDTGSDFSMNIKNYL